MTRFKEDMQNKPLLDGLDCLMIWDVSDPDNPKSISIDQFKTNIQGSLKFDVKVLKAFDSNIPMTNVGPNVYRIEKEDFENTFIVGNTFHARKQTTATANGIYKIVYEAPLYYNVEKSINNDQLNEVKVQYGDLTGIWFSSYNGKSLTFDWIKPFNAHRGGVVKVDYEAGSPMQFRDIYTNELMFETDVNGQLISYGRDGFANGAFISKTAQGQFRFEINTLNGNSYVKLYNANEEVIVHLDAASASKLFGLDASNERIRNVGNAVADYDALNKSQSESLFIPKTQNELTKEPTGFKRNEALTITANGDRTVTLTGQVFGYYQGTQISELVNGWVSPQHGTDTTKLYYLFGTSTNILWIDSPFSFDLLQICIAKYDNTNARWYYFRECHGFMSWQDHFEFHNNIGTYKSSGGLIPTNSYVLKSTVASERRIDVNEALIYDEDLPSVIPALTSKSYTQFALTGAGIDNIGLAKTDIINLSTNNPYYNQFTTSWVNTLVPTNSVFTVWDYVLPVTADPTSQDYRHLFVQPQWITQALNPSAGAIATAVSAEKNRLPSELNLNGLLSTEIVAINRITLSYHSGNWRIESVDVLSGNKYSQIWSPSGNYLTSSHLPWASSLHTGTANKLMSTDANGNASETDGNTFALRYANTPWFNTGTVSSVGTLVTFSGLGGNLSNSINHEEQRPKLTVNGVSRIITNRNNDTQVTIDSAFPSDLVSQAYNVYALEYSINRIFGSGGGLTLSWYDTGSIANRAIFGKGVILFGNNVYDAPLTILNDRLLANKTIGAVETDKAKIYHTDLNLVRRAFATEDNFVSYQPNPFYSTGTVSVSGTTVTIVGGTFSALMANNSKIRFQNGEERQITAYTDSTHVTIDRTTGGTVSGATFAIYLKRLFDNGTKLQTIDNEGNIIELDRSINSITAVSSGATYTLLNNRINVLVGSKLLLGNHIFTLEAPTTGIANEIEVEFEIGATLATIAFSQTLSGTIPTWEINAKYQFVIIQQKDYNGDWRYTFKGGKV